MKKKEMYDWLTEKRDLLLVKQEKMIKELFDFDRLPKRKQDISNQNIRVKDFTAFCSHPDDMKCEVDLKVFVYHSKLKAYSFETTRIIMSYYTFRTQYSDCTVRYFEKTTDGMYYYLVSMVK